MEGLGARTRRVVDRYITTAGRLQEIIYALIMVLTVTSTVSRTVPDSIEGIRRLVFAVLGCNIAWGIVDGVMYVLTSIFNRDRTSKIIRDATNTVSRSDALSILNREFDPPFEWILDEDRKRRLNEEILDRAVFAPPAAARMNRSDILGGVLCFVVTFLTTLPAVLPFLIITDMHSAIRASNIVALAMLFLVGIEYARFTDKNPIKTAVGLVLLGGVVVLVTILLGG
jgi:VIT1/CCC1 family predicted Fe2+/Mn2+ transporter